ncbi:hypothetical protein DERP_007246 [Dermatophagoides pteronyssinus]|uniref:Uncharacterized protein n=1 Tax=Dermatophagoides pteronyssinus TaxID=6956 RepID=A0ABQ8J3Z0_DERPT|nr:hypothetical protein DERP_007246 [Dermatophagoides pteronyssinus]
MTSILSIDRNHNRLLSILSIVMIVSILLFHSSSAAIPNKQLKAWGGISSTDQLRNSNEQNDDNVGSSSSSSTTTTTTTTNLATNNNDDNNDGQQSTTPSMNLNSSQPLMLNGTISPQPPHLVVSGRLVKPTIAQPLFHSSASSASSASSLFPKEDEYVEDEYEEEKKIKLPPKKLLGKLGGKKDESKKLLAIPVQESEYETVAQPVVEVKPVKKLKIKKPKIQPVAVAADEYAAAPVQPVASGYGYGAAPQAQPLLNSGYAPAPPMPYPGHYRIDSQPKGKFIPHFRQNSTENINDNGSTTLITENSDPNTNINSTLLESRETLTGVRSTPTFRSQIIPGYLAQEVTGSQSYLNFRNSSISSTNATKVDDRNKYNLYSAGVPQASVLAYSPPLPSYSSPSASSYAGYQPAPPPPAQYPYAYPAAPVYSPAPPVYLPPAAPAAVPTLGYTKVLNQVLDYYPSAASSSVYQNNNYSSQYDYSMPVAVVNVFCSDPHYPCSCTIYLTEINSYNMLISGVCSGLPKDSKFMMNLYPSGDITAGCNALGGYSSIGYRNPAAPIIELGAVKSDYQGVAFVNKLKHASIGVTCDKYGYKDSILGRAVGLVQMAIPVAVPVPYVAPTPSVYRRSAGGYSQPQLPLVGVSSGYGGVQSPLVLPTYTNSGKIAACGVIGLAGKDNSYETRELKSKLIANAKHE